MAATSSAAVVRRPAVSPSSSPCRCDSAASETSAISAAWSRASLASIRSRGVPARAMRSARIAYQAASASSSRRHSAASSSSEARRASARRSSRPRNSDEAAVSASARPSRIALAGAGHESSRASSRAGPMRMIGRPPSDREARTHDGSRAAAGGRGGGDAVAPGPGTPERPGRTRGEGAPGESCRPRTAPLCSARRGQCPVDDARRTGHTIGERT